MLEALFIGTSIVIATLLVAFACGDTKKFLFLGAMLLPIVIPPLSVGVSISWFKIIVPVALFGLLVRHGIDRHPFAIERISGAGPLYRFLLWVALVTTIHFLLQTHSTQIEVAQGLGWGAGQSTFRLPVQLIAYSFFYGLFFVGTWYVKDQADTAAVVSGYLTGTLLNALTGFYQVFAAGTGLPWLPTEILDSSLKENGGQYEIGRSAIFRLSGLAGEPKHAAAGFVFAIFLVLAFSRSSALDSKLVKSKATLWVLIAALALTMSTSGWFTAMVVTAYSAVMKSGHRLSRLVALSLVLVAVLCLAGLMVPQKTLDFILADRIINRMDDPASFEYKDFAVLQVAQSSPQSLVVGQGAGGIDFLLMPYVKTYQLQKGTITPTYILTQTLGDAGLIGVALILSFLLGATKKLRNLDPAYRHFAYTGAFAAVMLPRMAVSGYFMILGAFIAQAHHHKLRVSRVAKPREENPIQATLSAF